MKERGSEREGKTKEGRKKGRRWGKELTTVTLQWEAKIPRGQAPPGRGYHVALLHDARIFISGGYNGVSVFDDLWALDLSAAAYLPQVVCLFSSFSSFPSPPPFSFTFPPFSPNGSRIGTWETWLMIDYFRSRRNEEFPKWYPRLIVAFLYTYP